MHNPLKIFEKKKFPIVKVFEDYFEIKDVDYLKFRSFDYKVVVSIEYFKETEISHENFFFMGLWMFLFNKTSPSILRVNINNGGCWEYNCPNKIDHELTDQVEFLNQKIETRTPYSNT